MPKRFTDTSKWNRPWIRQLTPVNKCFLFYILDTCSAAGIWNVDFETAQYFINGKIPRGNPFPMAEFPIIELDGGKKWFIVDFIPFQYPNGLQPNNRAHTGIFRELEKYQIAPTNIWGSVEGLPSPIQGASKPLQVIDKEKVMEKEKEKEIGPAAEILVPVKLRNLFDTIRAETPVLFSMKDPLTLAQLERLAYRYAAGAILRVCRAMENKPDLQRKYKSANLTLQNWLAREGPQMDKPLLTRPSQEEPEPRPPTAEEREKMLYDVLLYNWDRFQKGEDLASMPGIVFSYMVNKGWVIIEGDNITYHGQIACTKTEMKQQAAQAIAEANVKKNTLTIGQAFTTFAKPDDLARSLAAKRCFELFRTLGVPWQMTT